MLQDVNDSPPQAAPAKVIRSTKVWISDGTIILKAGSTMFRVYKGTLTTHSDLFRDLFQQAHPDEQSYDEGCPVLDVQDDPKTLELFLRILHEWRYTETCKIGFREAVRIVNLSDKYGADDVAQWAIERYIDRIYRATELEHYLSLAKSKERWLQGCDHVAVVNIARRCKRKDLLPLAFYLAATTLTLDEIYRGVQGREGHLVIFDDPEDAKRCAEGKLRITSTFQVSYFLPDREGGLGSFSTTQLWDDASLGRWLPTNEPTSPLDETTVTIKNLEPLLPAYCTPGATRKALMHRSGVQQLIWNSIPRIFGLDPWEAA